MQKVVKHPLLGEISYIKRARSRRISISVSVRNGIRVNIPVRVPYQVAEQFVEENVPKLEEMKRRLMARSGCTVPAEGQSVPEKRGYSRQELDEIRQRAKRELPSRLRALSERLNREVVIRGRFGRRVEESFTYNSVAIKNNRSNWGSCSAKRNINLNMHLVNLPAHLADMVMLHELVHLVYPNHGDKFHSLMELLCGGNEQVLRRELKGYTHLIDVPE